MFIYFLCFDIIIKSFILKMIGPEIGRVFNFFEKVNVAAIELSKELKLGDTIRIVGGNCDITHIVDSIQIDGKFVEYAKAKDRIGIKVKNDVNKGAKVFKVY
jgi:hypothetical protein